MAVFGFGRRNAVGRQYNGGNVSVMLPRYTTPPERNTRDWLEMFGRNPRLAVVDRIASDLSTCAGKLYRKDENGEDFVIGVWPGKCCFPDMLDDKARQWFGDKYRILIDK